MDRGTALARLRAEMERPPFHRVLRPQAIDVDPADGTITIALRYDETLARAPGEQSFHGGVIATLIDIACHAAVAVQIGRMAPTIDNTGHPP
jgi:acyl-coenzyme A thioesterase PaaI-like protein